MDASSSGSICVRRKARLVDHLPEAIALAGEVVAGLCRVQSRIETAKHDGEVIGQEVG